MYIPSIEIWKIFDNFKLKLLKVKHYNSNMSSNLLRNCKILFFEVEVSKLPANFIAKMIFSDTYLQFIYSNLILCMVWGFSVNDCSDDFVDCFSRQGSTSTGVH